MVMQRAWSSVRALAVALGACLLLSDALAAGRVVRVGVFDNPPLITYDPELKTAKGLAITVLESAARHEGWRLEFVPGSFAEGLERLRAGSVDLMPNVAHRRGRTDGYYYNEEPMVSSWGQVYARPGSGLARLPDLANKRISLLDGGVSHEYLTEEGGRRVAPLSIQPWATVALSFGAVAAGEADAVVANPFSGRYQARRFGLQPVPIVLAPYTFRFAVAHASAHDLLDAVDRELVRLKAEPHSPYFAELQNLTGQYEDASIPEWVWVAGSMLMALTLIGIAWSRSHQAAAEKLRVSERKQRHLAEKLGHVFNGTLDAIVVLDSQYRLVRCNAATERLAGVPMSEIIGRSVFDFLPAEQVTGVRKMLEEVRGGTPSLCFEATALRRGLPPAHVVWSSVWSEQQQEFYSIGRDDTERRQLLQRLQQRGAQLQLANEELQTFARSVSHDLRGPVAAIRAFVEKVIRTSGEQLPEQNLSLLQRSLAAADRMDQLIADLLRLARLSEHGLRRRSCDLTGMARAVADGLLAARAQRVNLEVLGEIQVNADPQLLQIVLENLIGNAWKFTSKKAGARIQVGCETVEGQRAVYVRDNGAGFDMQYAEKLFSPFRRLHAPTEFEGTGIGLSIVHKIITRHGGRIWAQGYPDRGAIFWFTLGGDDGPDEEASIDQPGDAVGGHLRRPHQSLPAAACEAASTPVGEVTAAK